MFLFEILKTILIGVVQGITEWLPISSTGHMILIDEFIKLNMSDEFKEMFFVVIQFGSILAVLFLYWDRLFPFSKAKEKPQRKEIYRLWIKIIIAIIPAAVVGLIFDDILNELFYWYIPIAIALVVYGVLFIVIENRNKNRPPRITKMNKLDFKTALLIGCFQTLALIPGTSRSGSTILGAMLLGTSRKVAAEFSFFLAVPVMLGASLLKLVKYGGGFTGQEIAVLLVGMATAFFVSVFAIRFLMGFIRKHSFKPFGWYRIILGIILIVYYIAVHA
ncbi:MAG: undecaprenyl-diphosphate phosphatase [Clostridia bacterium]|jgi:undecaprenyl-diphosphatase|nr:undecaprenyl-diphosphate phosphatase [Clostridia bacterium]